ncbi:hypothetical protein V6Z11_D08G006800 [Gossypium hirsutum]
MPLFHKKVTCNTFQFVIDKVRRKLNPYHAKLLALAGRVTLAKSVLLAIPYYFMKIMLLPIKVSHEIEKLAWQFIWGTTNTACKVSLIKWESCYQPVESAGLGIRGLEVQNKRMIFGYKFFATNTDLGMVALFRLRNQVAICIFGDHSRGYGHNFEANICWSLRTGRCVQFWMDTWVPDVGPLSDLFPGMVAGIEDLRISNVVDSLGNWRWDSTFLRITFIPPPTMGQFSVSTAYKHLVAGSLESKEEHWKHLWKLRAPFRVKHFLWLLYKERVLTSFERCRRGFSDDASCPPCGHDVETNSLHGAFFRGELSFWLTNKIPNVTHVSLLNVPWEVLFAIVCWRLWKQRNAVVFQQKHSSTEDFVASCWSWAASVHKAADLRL